MKKWPFQLFNMSFSVLLACQLTQKIDNSHISTLSVLLHWNKLLKLEKCNFPDAITWRSAAAETSSSYNRENETITTKKTKLKTGRRRLAYI